MEKLTISEMLTDTAKLTEVFDANPGFQREIMDDMAESEMFWIGEQLDELKPHLSSWSIGQCNRAQHITVQMGHEAEFIEAMNKLQSDYGIFGEDGEKELRQAVKTIEEYHETDVMTDRFDKLSDEVDGYARKFARMLCDHYTRILDGYCLDDDNAREYFIEFYSECRMDGDEYVIFDEDGDTDWTLHKDVAYTKTWAV